MTLIIIAATTIVMILTFGAIVYFTNRRMIREMQQEAKHLNLGDTRPVEYL